MCGCLLLKLEVDVDRVGAAAAEAGGEGVNLNDPLDGSFHGLVHHRVGTSSNDFGRRNFSIFFDADLDRADELISWIKDRGGLVPLTKKSVMDEFMIPTELRRVTLPGRFGGGAISCVSLAGCRFLVRRGFGGPRG